MFAKSQSDNLSRTNAALMETPLFSDLYKRTQELEEQVHMLKCNISYFESTNRKLLRKVDKLKVELKSCKKEKKEKKNGLRKEGPAIKMTIEEELVPRQLEKEFDETFEEEVETSVEEVETFEATSKNNVIVIEDDEEEEEEEEEEVIVVEDEETSAGSDSCEATKEEEVIVVEEEAEEEEEVEVEGEEETSAGSDSCEATKEVVVVEEEEEVEGEEEEVVVEGEEEEEATEEEVVVEGEEATEEEEDVYEIEINGKTYYVSNEQNSVIYAADESGDITIEAGVYKNGKPVFN